MKNIKEVKPEKVKKNKTNKALIDRAIYWLAQAVFAALTAAGIYHYLEPVDPILSLSITTIFVAMLFYISIKNR